MKILLAFLAYLSLISASAYASEEGIVSRIISCTINGKADELVYVYVGVHDYQRTNREEGANIFEKLVKKTNGEFKIRFNFAWGDDKREFIADIKYTYDADQKKMSALIGEDGKFELNYSPEQNSTFRLKDTGNRIDLICSSEKK